ncbi:MAG TPA: hypothetical protein VFF67_06235 [Thermoplasmata archaeon]|nr:hypothetical protein [Thermoplasmata archaeon]
MAKRRPAKSSAAPRPRKAAPKARPTAKPKPKTALKLKPKPAAAPKPAKAKPAATAKPGKPKESKAAAPKEEVGPPAPRSGDARRHVLSLSFLRDGDEFLARLETDSGQITELKNRSLDQLLTLVAGELEDLLE